MDLEDYRREIDKVNAEIVDAVSKRMNVVEEIGQLKKERDMDIVDEDREEKVRQQFEKLFKDEDLPKEKGREFANFLINLARDRQEDERL